MNIVMATLGALTVIRAADGPAYRRMDKLGIELCRIPHASFLAVRILRALSSPEVMNSPRQPNKITRLYCDRHSRVFIAPGL